MGGVSPQIFKINPANRETLADVLFTSGGPLSASKAKRSEIVTRGSKPVVAYHLDAQSPTRLIVADAMELSQRYACRRATYNIFNRTLATIMPLRILLRDIQDEKSHNINFNHQLINNRNMIKVAVFKVTGLDFA